MYTSNETEEGFTLLEVLIVLIIWSILILLIVPINFSHLEKQQEKYFFETFAFDVLYTQNLSTTTKDYVQINLYENSYLIRRGYRGKIIVERELPSDWIIEEKLLQTISFDDKGRVRKPGNFVIRTKHKVYKVIFPFGKGRFHIVEQ
jgi:competence protein ComGD